MSNVPKLRFSEFSGEWEEKKLKELTQLITKGTTPKKFSDGEIAFVKIEGLQGINIIKEKCLFIDEKTHVNELKRSILQENDILFAIAGATIGKVALVTKEILPANTNQALSIIRLKDNDYLNFILQNLQSDMMKKYIQESISVGAQPNLNLQQMGDFQFFTPSKPEQEKIASFLTSVDTKIEQLTKKEVLLQEYKKGVMNKIFNQEIRFKDVDGSEFPEWEENKLDDVLVTVSTKPYQIKSSDIIEEGNYKVIDQGQKLVAGYCNDNNKVYKDGEIIVYGDHTTIVKYIDFDFIVGADGTKLLTTIKSNNLKYLYYNLIYNNIEPEGYKRHFSILRNILLQVPFLEEQTKIANFLSSIDKKIELTTKELNSTKEFKKALLQQMFV